MATYVPIVRVEKYLSYPARHKAKTSVDGVMGYMLALFPPFVITTLFFVFR